MTHSREDATSAWWRNAVCRPAVGADGATIDGVGCVRPARSCRRSTTARPRAFSRSRPTVSDLFARTAICELLGYSNDELLSLSVADIHPAESLPEVQAAFEAMRRPPEVRAEHPLSAKDGTCLRRYAVNYLACGPDPAGGLLSRHHEQNRTIELLRESESTLRSLLENLPDLVVTVDRSANVQFVNRGTPDMDREAILGACGFGLVVPEHQPACRRALEQAFATGVPQTVEVLDIFGHWWSCRVVPLAKEGDAEHAHGDLHRRHPGTPGHRGGRQGAAIVAAVAGTARARAAAGGLRDSRRLCPAACRRAVSAARLPRDARPQLRQGLGRLRRGRAIDQSGHRRDAAVDQRSAAADSGRIGHRPCHRLSRLRV